MDRFEYVMVLVSIIVGLGLAHVLFGVGRLIDRITDGRPIRLGWAHGLWLAYVFLWTIQFWWWEYRFSELDPDWTLGLYLFLVSYAIVLFLLTVILVPHSWDPVEDLDVFFIRRKSWFYWALLAGIPIDLLDGYLKGGMDYVTGFGFSLWGLWSVTVLACTVGLLSDRMVYHRIGAAAVLIAQVGAGFDDLPTLGF